MVRAYLRAQASSFSAFVISKTHMVTQKPHGRQLNAKVGSSKSVIFLLLQTTMFNNQTNRLEYSLSFQHKTDAYHGAELYSHLASSQLQHHPGQFTTLCGYCPLRKTPFCNFLARHAHKQSRSQTEYYAIPTLQLQTSVKRCRDEALYIYLHSYIIPTLFVYRACHPYISLHFQRQLDHYVWHNLAICPWCTPRFCRL